MMTDAEIETITLQGYDAGFKAAFSAAVQHIYRTLGAKGASVLAGSLYEHKSIIFVNDAGDGVVVTTKVDFSEVQTHSELSELTKNR